MVKIVTPTDYTAFDAEELKALIKLQEEAVLVKEIEVEDAAKPYQEIEEEYNHIHLQLKAAGALLQDRRDALKKAQRTLAKLQDMHAGKRGGLMYQKNHQAELEEQPTREPVVTQDKPEPKKKRFNWQEAAIQVLTKADRLIEVNKLFDKILHHVPAYQQAFNAMTASVKSATRTNAVRSLTDAATREHKQGEKRFGYHKGCIGLVDWFEADGTPKVKYTAFTGGTYMDSKTENNGNEGTDTSAGQPV